MKTTCLAAAAACVIALNVQCFGQTCPTPKAAYEKGKDSIPLCLVAAKIKDTLDHYNSDPTTVKGDLPSLSKAEFDFKTTRTNVGGFSLNIFVFKFGATHQSDTTEDVTFSYSKPPKTTIAPGGKGYLGKPPQHDFSKDLIDLLKVSAEQVKAARTFGSLPLNSLTLNMSFGVTWDFSAGASVPIVALITAGGSFDHKNAAVQSVKLTFGPD